MAKRNRTPKRPTPRRNAAGGPRENRASEAVTVFWMLTLMATLGAELASLAGRGLLALAEDPADVPGGVRMLPGLLLLVALVTGILCLLLTPVVYRVRSEPPPLGVTVIAALVGVSPLVALLLIQLANRA